MITELTMEDLQTGLPTPDTDIRIVMFYGAECGPCKATMPNYEAVAKFFVENPREPDTVGSVSSRYPELFKAVTAIEKARQEELGNEKQGLTKEAALKDANNTLERLKNNPKVDSSRIEGLSKFIKYLNESSSIGEAFDKHFENYKNKETNKVDEEVQLNFDSILASKNQINAKYDAELAALEGAPVSDVEATDIEKLQNIKVLKNGFQNLEKLKNLLLL